MGLIRAYCRKQVPGKTKTRRVAGLAVTLAVAMPGCLSRPTASKGKELYDSNGCASCHGRDGRGDGAIARTIEVPPTDFRHPETFLRGSTPDTIAKTLSDGIAVHLTTSGTLKQTHHELVMPRFNHLSEEERHSLALYVLSISKEKTP